MRAHGAGPDLPRDRAVLIRLARHRVLSLAQVQKLVFPGLHRTRVSRRLSALQRSGWLNLWVQPVERGGRPRFVVPTVRGLRWAMARIEAEASVYPYWPLITTMPRRDGRQRLPLAPGVTPPWLAHLREVNDVLVALMADTSLAVPWASSWTRPFPDLRREVALPQPDAIVVLQAPDSSIELVFLEHDRGGESLKHFRSHKVERYRQLAQRPELLAELTGYRAFKVLVTVRTGDPTTTQKRLDELEHCARSRLASQLFTFLAAEQGLPPSSALLDWPGVQAPDVTPCPGPVASHSGAATPQGRDRLSQPLPMA